MEYYCDKWYYENKEVVDSIVKQLIRKLKENVYISTYLNYSFSFDEDNLEKDLIKYIYQNS
jgi:hypothetical protein